MIEIGIFVIFSLAFFLLPGLLLLRWARLSIPLLKTITLGFVIGSAIFIMLSVLIRLISIPFSLLYVYPILLVLFNRSTIWSWLSKIHILRKKISVFDILAITVWVLLVISLSIGHLGSGFIQGRLHLSAARDSFWRLSIISEIVRFFPPQIPGFPPFALKNYHFFYDFLIGSVYMLTKIPIVSLYFQYFTLFSAALFVLSLYCIIRQFVKSKGIALFGTIMTVFTGNMSYLLRFISTKYTFVAQSNVFMSDQPFDQSHNPFNLFAYAFFISVFLLFYSWENNKQWKIFLLLSIVLGILPGIKVYAAIVLFAGLVFIMGYIFIVKRKFFIYSFAPIIIAFATMPLIKGKGFSILTFSPGWLLAKMVQDHDRLFLSDMVLKEQHYRQTGNIVRLIQIKTTQVLFYFLGNLNIRIISFVIFLKRLREKFIYTETVIFIVIASILSLIFPLMFSQTRGVYDSIQFTPYGLLLLSIISIAVIEKVFNLMKRKNMSLGLMMLLLLFLIAVPTNAYLLKERINAEKDYIEASEVNALFFLKNDSDRSDIILSDIAEEKLRLMYIPAISERRVFLSGSALTKQLGISTSQRKQVIDNFFSYDITMSSDTLQLKKKFLKENDIAYVYLSRSGLKHQRLMKVLELPVIFENDLVSIYKSL